jgi:hypothetical protein
MPSLKQVYSGHDLSLLQRFYINHPISFAMFLCVVLIVGLVLGLKAGPLFWSLVYSR